jgi:glycosyltransferase involved in cell wall biosynthesis
MRILFALTYYRPHISGLTNHVASLAEELAARGHSVAVLTSRHDPTLLLAECLQGVEVKRVPVAFRIGKGPMMRSYAKAARVALRERDVVVINLPASPAETVLLPLLARWNGIPVIAISHCDLHLPRGLINRCANLVGNACNFVAGFLAQTVVTHSEDYGTSSPLVRAFSRKAKAIPPAVRLGLPNLGAARELRRQIAPEGGPVIGVAARLATEKGIEFLLEALPAIRARVGHTKIVFSGEARPVLGERAYWERLRPIFDRVGPACVFLGGLAPSEMPAFYAACDVTVLPSTNRTEAFGLVQLESMLCGTPVVASDSPGMRVPIVTTGMGRLALPHDAASLAEAICKVIESRERYVRSRPEIASLFSFERMADQYENLLETAAALSHDH